MAKPERPKNEVRIGLQGSKLLYADITKHLLHDGEPYVILSALGLAINDAVSVVEMLKEQQMVKVTKIKSERRDDIVSNRRPPTNRLEIIVVKIPGFDEKYAEQQKIREEKAAARKASTEK